MSEAWSPEEHNPSRIIVAGDWHRNMFAAFPKKVVALAERMAVDTILHVGDFGYRFGSDDAKSFEKPLHLALAKAGVKLFWIDGNHENHRYLQELPREGSFIKTGARGDVYYIPRGHRWSWGGKNFGALGGAFSINRPKLVEGKTLFAELEEPTEADLIELGDKPLDYLISHDVPGALNLSSIVPERRPTQTAALLQSAVETTQPKRVFAGHWHARRDLQLELSSGKITHVHILDREWTPGNALLLELKTDQITPPPANWHSS